jgi:hypothetical protein
MSNSNSPHIFPTDQTESANSLIIPSYSFLFFFFFFSGGRSISGPFFLFVSSLWLWVGNLIYLWEREGEQDTDTPPPPSSSRLLALHGNRDQ